MCCRYVLGYVWEKENFVIWFDFEWICWSAVFVCYKVPKSPRFLLTISFGSDGLTTWINAIFRQINLGNIYFEIKYDLSLLFFLSPRLIWEVVLRPKITRIFF